MKLALANPQLAGSAMAKNLGVAELTVNVPANAPKIDIRFQAAEPSNTSGVVKRTIQ